MSVLQTPFPFGIEGKKAPTFLLCFWHFYRLETKPTRKVKRDHKSSKRRSSSLKTKFPSGYQASKPCSNCSIVAWEIWQLWLSSLWKVPRAKVTEMIFREEVQEERRDAKWSRSLQKTSLIWIFWVSITYACEPNQRIFHTKLYWRFDKILWHRLIFKFAEPLHNNVKCVVWLCKATELPEKFQTHFQLFHQKKRRFQHFLYYSQEIWLREIHYLLLWSYWNENRCLPLWLEGLRMSNHFDWILVPHLLPRAM